MSPDWTLAFPIPSIDFTIILPMIVVMVTGILALLVDIVRPGRNNNAVVVTSLAGLIVAGILTASQFSAGLGATMAGMVVRDGFALSMQLLLILSCFLAILFSEGYLREKRIPFGEFYPLVIWSTAGGMLMCTTRNMLVLFLGLEILSIALYVMAGMSRNEPKSHESSLKYFLLGAFASGFFLYGIAFIYGATGSLELTSIGVAALGASPMVQGLLLFGLGLLLVGLCFKAAFVPFHQWTPDVYQGAPTNVTTFMAAGSKIAAIAMLYRVLESSDLLVNYWLPALTGIAILTMTVGNLVALLQTDVKRILGYSSISNAGYILVALIAFGQSPAKIGFDTIAYYLLSYSLMTVGAFAVVSMVAKAGAERTGLKDLNGLWQRSPLAALALLICMASLIGIPPTAGFVGKLLIFRDALETDNVLLAIVLGVNSVISIWYYLAIARAAFVADEEADREASGAMYPGLAGTLAICIVGILAAGIFVTPINRFFNTGEQSDTIEAAQPQDSGGKKLVAYNSRTAQPAHPFLDTVEPRSNYMDVDQLLTERQRLLNQYGPNHPKVKEFEERLKAMPAVQKPSFQHTFELDEPSILPKNEKPDYRIHLIDKGAAR